ncbi:MAG: tRNA pseudouridine(13) synthase TruD [Ilumatobacteraceae bacterium]
MDDIPESIAARLREAERLKQIQRDHPEQFQRDLEAVAHKIPPYIGMQALPADLPVGYIRLHPEDFIVEEVDATGTIHTIEPDAPDVQGDASEDGQTVYCDLVKRGLGTQEAQELLAAHWNIGRDRILYAGMKDEVAITSQEISIRKLPLNQVHGTQLSNIFLKNCRTGKGLQKIGRHEGNRFTIIVRTREPLDEAVFEQRMHTIASEGFLNFYGQQRFGYSPHGIGDRYSGHLIGQRLCQGKYDEAIQLFLCATNEAEIPLFRELRQQARAIYGQWNNMAELFGVFPETFHRELTILRALAEDNGNALSAIKALDRLVFFWVHGYVSFVFNLKLSQLAQAGAALPETLPLVLSRAAEDQAPYREIIAEHGTEDMVRNVEPVYRVGDQRRQVRTKIIPTIHHLANFDGGTIVQFTLPTGAYATTFLQNAFTLLEDAPIPAWVQGEAIDSKATLGEGSVASASRRLSV